VPCVHASFAPSVSSRDVVEVGCAWESWALVRGGKAGANAGYSEGDSAQQEARARLEAGESDPAGATATARR
jgi:hypothetical protein